MCFLFYYYLCIRNYCKPRQKAVNGPNLDKKQPVKMKKTIFFLLFFFSACCMAQGEKEAEGVIRRFAGREIPMHLALSLKPVDGCDQFETSVKNGKLTIKGSSGVALCRGFYEYVRQHKAGLCTWTGKRLSLPQRLDDQSTTRKVSPYKHHYYLNVVTYGYTMPYWDWARWQEEIDWMALHGIDMPLMLVANEAIYARVLQRMGMNEADINAYFVGPAHLPWMRMGNISGIDGPLTASWHRSQIALAHKILARMRALGMQPICPAFAGFVPQALQKFYPKAQITETSWSGGAFHNWMLSADEPLFHTMGKLLRSGRGNLARTPTTWPIVSTRCSCLSARERTTRSTACWPITARRYTAPLPMPTPGPCGSYRDGCSVTSATSGMMPACRPC